MTPQEDSKPGRTRGEGNITYTQTEFATRVASPSYCWRSANPAKLSFAS